MGAVVSTAPIFQKRGMIMSIAILTGASAGLGKSFFASLQKRHPDLTGIWLIARRRQRLEAMAGAHRFSWWNVL